MRHHRVPIIQQKLEVIPRGEGAPHLLLHDRIGSHVPLRTQVQLDIWNAMAAQPTLRSLPRLLTTTRTQHLLIRKRTHDLIDSGIHRILLHSRRVICIPIRHLCQGAIQVHDDRVRELGIQRDRREGRGGEELWENGEKREELCVLGVETVERDGIDALCDSLHRDREGNIEEMILEPRRRMALHEPLDDPWRQIRIIHDHMEPRSMGGGDLGMLRLRDKRFVFGEERRFVVAGGPECLTDLISRDDHRSQM